MNAPFISLAVDSAGSLTARLSGFQYQNGTLTNDGTDWQVIDPNNQTVVNITLGTGNNLTQLSYQCQSYGTYTVKARYHGTGTDLGGNPWNGYSNWGLNTVSTGAAPQPVIDTPNVTLNLA